MIKKLASIALASALVSVIAIGLSAEAETTPNWDASGEYVVSFMLGDAYLHDVTIAQDSSGAITGSGSYPAGGTSEYSWHITSGSVTGDQINLTAVYDTGAPGVVMHMTGTIAENGGMSGVWDDNLDGNQRDGTWFTTEGVAEEIDDVATLAAEDFGVVSYDTGLGMLKGYTAGFALTDATFDEVQSVVVRLYAGDTLLQTNIATSKVMEEIMGSQISSPFDVSGDFDYATDGYWTNIREGEHGQTLAADRVMAIVVLEDGQVLTAENVNLTGDPDSIMPEPETPSDSPMNKEECKKGGWQTFSNPSFKNQGACVSHVQAHQK